MGRAAWPSRKRSSRPSRDLLGEEPTRAARGARHPSGRSPGCACSSPRARRTSRSIRCAISPTAPPASRAMRLARAAAALGAEVTLVSGPVALPDPQGVRVVKVETAHEMLAAALAAPSRRHRHLRRRRRRLARRRRVAAETEEAEPGRGRAQARRSTPTSSPPSPSPGRKRPRLVIGFAAETENLIENATAKRRAKGADWIVANDVWPGTGAMGGDRTQVHLVTAGGRRGLAAAEQGRDGGAPACPRRGRARRHALGG